MRRRRRKRRRRKKGRRQPVATAATNYSSILHLTNVFRSLVQFLFSLTGVVGYALTTWDPTSKQPVVALDVGGTSSDVSRFAGAYEHVFEATVAGVSIQAPQLDISTVAAGGGSRLFFR